MEKTKKYNVIFRSEPEGGFTVIVPSLPGLCYLRKRFNRGKKNGGGRN